MATTAENVAAARANLETSLVNATTRLAELDALPLDQRVSMTVTVAGRTIGFNEYRAALMEQVKGTKDALLSLQSLAGPFTVRTGTVRG